MSRTGFVAVMSLWLPACTLGMRTKNFAPAQGPEGVRIEALVRSAGAQAPAGVKGELLEVREAALLVLTSSGTRRVLEVPYAAIEAASFQNMGRKASLAGGVLPSPALRELLRKLSRFPQGLRGELLAQLLKTHGQTAVEDASQ